MLLHASHLLPECSPLQPASPAPTRTTDDRKARELIDTKNQADSMVYQTEKQLKEFADKVRGGARSSGWQQTGAVSGSRHERLGRQQSSRGGASFKGVVDLDHVLPYSAGVQPC